MYRAAEVSAGAEFTLTGDFAEYPVKVNGLDSSGWRALAQTLDGYAARDGLNPLRTVETGKDGRAVFDHLDTGLYLVTGSRYRQGRYTYTPEPFLIALPALDEADAWVYDTVVSCKYDSSYDLPGGGGGDGGHGGGGGYGPSGKGGNGGGSLAIVAKSMFNTGSINANGGDGANGGAYGGGGGGGAGGSVVVVADCIINNGTIESAGGAGGGGKVSAGAGESGFVLVKELGAE